MMLTVTNLEGSDFILAHVDYMLKIQVLPCASLDHNLIDLSNTCLVVWCNQFKPRFFVLLFFLHMVPCGYIKPYWKRIICQQKTDILPSRCVDIKGFPPIEVKPIQERWSICLKMEIARFISNLSLNRYKTVYIL